MYGTIFRMKVKPGQTDRLIQLNNEWNREMMPKVNGALAALLLQPDNRPNEMVGVAIFRDREAYRANLNNPEQDQWYRQLRECLEADPEWEDGEYVATGGLDQTLLRAA